MIQSKFTRTLALGICFTALSSSIALANGGGVRPSTLPGQLPADMVKTDLRQPVDMGKLPVNPPDASVTYLAQEQRMISEEILQKQREIDKYLFEDHAEEMNKKDFVVTHTGSFDDYVEIGITQYSEENARYLYDIFGEDQVKVVEGQQAVTLPLDAIDIGVHVDEVIAQYENQMIKDDKGIGIQVNGQRLQLDVEPFIENNRTLIPLRGVMEKLGTEVEWHPEEATVEVHAEDISIELVIGEDTAKIIRNMEGTLKEEAFTLEVAAKIVGGRTFIPGRFVTETLGAKVQWDNSLRAMIIETDNRSDISSVENVVENFGEKLKLVSLLASKDIVSESMQENYSEFVSSSLLEKWKNDPENAPGRLTSSPWPDRIEILNTEKRSEHKYEVKGEIIEVSSVEETSGGVTAKQPITLLVKKDNNHWLIDDVTIGTFEETHFDVYKNTQYGFNFYLPESWEDYVVIDDEWEGTYIEDLQDEKIDETGPMIYIRHPQWTSQNQRQDIPIMIFTLDQWDSLQQREFNIGAAPVRPKELGRNNKYVFALPARYNYEFLTGYEEVENILENDPLKPIEDNHSDNK